VWTNVIGVMLVALALGAWLGGLWAGGAGAGRRLTMALLVAALVTAVVPVVVRPLGSWLVPQELPLEAAMAALVRGSLVATLLLFAPPVLLLGCASPMLVAALAEGGVRVGRASGLINACSTLGSLSGTFLATHLLLPTLGSRGSVWLCAGVVALCAALLRGRLAPAAAAVPALVLALWVRGPLRKAPPGQQLIAEHESAQQYLQVLRRPGADGGPAVTTLKINEGLDSFHSLAIDGTAWTDGAYYDWHAIAPILAHDGRIPDGAGLRVLSLGSAAGTFARLFAAAFPGCLVDGVEIDPAVVTLGELYFGGRHAAGRDHAGLDARVFVERAPAARYDVVLVDTYARQIYVPAHVASVEFFTAAARCLRPGGVVSVNSGGWSFDDPVVVALGATMTAVFGEAFALRVPWNRNFVLLARKEAALDPTVLSSITATGGDLGRVVAKAAQAGAWRRLSGAGPVLTDDRPMLDELQHEAMRRARRDAAPALTAIAGEQDPDQAAEAAHALLVADRPTEVLAAVGRARSATPYLRLLAGDARWALHDVAGAHAEFTAALALPAAGDHAMPEAVRAALTGRKQSAGELLASLQRAADTAGRNGLLVWLAVAAFAAAAGALVRRAATAARPAS
jgi:spermidine synthase